MTENTTHELRHSTYLVSHARSFICNIELNREVIYYNLVRPNCESILTYGVYSQYKQIIANIRYFGYETSAEWLYIQYH